jgi:excisionase family DNA binding protein
MPVELPSPGVWLDARDCALIDRALRLGLVELTTRNGAPAAGVEQVAAAIYSAAARFRQHHPVPATVRRSAPGSGTDPAPNLAPAAASTPNGWKTAQEVADRFSVSESYVRRLARQGRLTARRTGRGAWLVDAASLAAWAADRHTDVA